MSTKREPSSSRVPISMSKRWLKSHGKEIVTVQGWADKMGYSDSVSFFEEFRRVFGCRPHPVLLALRAREVIRLLHEGGTSNFEIAADFRLRDEKGLYQFIKRQTTYAPSEIRELPEPQYRKLLERLEKKMIEKH